MKRISSRDNPMFKRLRLLSTDTGARRDAGVALLEGIHLADAFLRGGGVPRQFVVGASALGHAEVSAILSRTTTDALLVVDDALYASLSQLPQGVALLTIIERPQSVSPSRLTRSSVVLDRIQDPGNVGSILRSAAAAGIVDVYLSAQCADAWSPKVLRAGMGAHFSLSIHDDTDLVTLKKSATIPWIATMPRAPRTIHQVDLRGDVAWVFGHEGQGIDASLTTDAIAVRIPQPGQGESLNVAAAAAICFFEQVRQREAT